MSRANTPSCDRAGLSPRDFVYAPPECALDILHADAHILVLNKPAGLLTVAGKTADLADCLETRAQSLFPSARVIHRLDKDTSGVIVLGLTAHAHAHIGKQFEKRQTSKTYQALVWGAPAGDAGQINEPLITDWPNRPMQHICYERGRTAITDWRVLDRGAHSRVELKPLTGRTHQLRVHLAHIGHPILGDNLYAGNEALRASDRLCLHATQLGFRHPEGGAHLNFTSNVPF